MVRTGPEQAYRLGHDRAQEFDSFLRRIIAELGSLRLCERPECGALPCLERLTTGFKRTAKGTVHRFEVVFEFASRRGAELAHGTAPEPARERVTKTEDKML